MFSIQGSEKIHDFVRQAASLHVVNTVYFLGLVVLVLYSLHLGSGGEMLIVPNLGTFDFFSLITLCVILFSKVLVTSFPRVNEMFEEEQFELSIAFLNVLATFSIVESIKLANPEALFLLYSFLPMVLLILISPLTWNKKHDGYVGFYGFLEWSLLLLVFYWSSMSVVFLFENGDYIALVSNGVVFIGPFFLKFIRKAHMEKLMKKMYEEIYVDPLTELKNRKCFYEYYDKVRGLNRAKEFNSDGVGVVFVDVDHFKKYNDFYGHAKGDECLHSVGAFLTSLVSTLDGWSVYRYGGEEFLLVGPINKDSWNSLVDNGLFKRWRDGLLRLDMEHEASTFRKVTLSGGACFVPLAEIYTSNAGGITKQADALLYEAKEKRANLNFKLV